MTRLDTPPRTPATAGPPDSPAAGPPAGLRVRRGAGRAAQYTALLGYLVFLAFPLVWLLSTALKTPQELGLIDPTWLPQDPGLHNFRAAVEQQPVFRSLGNSLLIAVTSAVLTVAVATPAAYVLARRRSAAGRVVTGWVLVSQMVPFALVIIPLFLLLRHLRLVDSGAGAIAVYVVWNLPFALWMLQGYVKALPLSLEEAAAVDGCGRLRTLRSVVFPLLAPGVVATSMFSFIATWNEFFFALVLLKSPEKQTMPVTLTHFLGAEGAADLGPLAAAALMATVPSLVFFAFLQRRLVSGMLGGAVKG